MALRQRLLPLAIAAGQLLAAAILPPSAVAEESDESTIIYPASYFTQYDPVSVNDMLTRIPGVSLVIDEDTGSATRRGLGAGENQILINGRRVAGKENEGRNQLDRIAASSVDHIEIIRGTSGDMDVRSSGVVINIVLREEESKRSIAAELNLSRYQDQTLDPGGLLSLSGQKGDLTYLFSVEAESWYEYRVGHETSVLGDRSPNDAVTRAETRDQLVYTLNTNLGFTPSERTQGHLNALIREGDPPMHIVRRIEDRTGPSPTLTYHREEVDAESDRWEIGGDVEHRFGNDSRYKLLFIFNGASDTSTRERFVSTDADATETQQLYLDIDTTHRERIVRTSWTRPFGADQDLELGVERAQTILESSLLYAQSDPGGAVPATDSSVEEMRYEVFAVHNWQLGSRARLESSLTAEYSEISQSGDVRNKRDFRFVRPKLDYGFDITPTMQLRASIARDIAQLSFAQFVAASDTMDDDTDVVSGNPELVQEKSWQYEANLEYRLPEDGGVINARLLYHDIEDVIDMVDVSPSPTELDSAPGNIGDGKRYGLLLSGSLRFGFIDLPDAVLTTAVSIEKSDVTDPFLGVTRPLPFRDHGYIRVGFQHDLPAMGANYGFNYFRPRSGDKMQYDIDTIEDYYTEPTLSLFIEKVVGRITLRLDSRNVTEGLRCRDRYRYDGHLANRSLAEVEDSCSTPGNTIALSVRGTF